MVSNIDVFHLPVVFGILRKCHGSAIIPFDYPWHGVLDFDLIKPALHPNHLLGTS